MAIEAASHSILETMQWRQKRKFMTPQQLQPWDQLVSPSPPSFLPPSKCILCRAFWIPVVDPRDVLQAPNVLLIPSALPGGF